MALLRVALPAALPAGCLTGCQQVSHGLADKAWPM
jgi:hypothetical protein